MVFCSMRGLHAARGVPGRCGGHDQDAAHGVHRAIFDTLYGFEYLTRPYRRAPRTAAAMPEIIDEGRTWTMRVKPGIYFADDTAFKGRKRELTAADYVY